jgi:ketosteroid isomerase-like protein
MRLLYTLFIAALLAACASAPTSDRDTIARLKAQADAWDVAIVRKDRAAIAGNMAEDFRQIDGFGNIEDKASFVNDVVSGDLTIDPYTVEDFEVRLLGDVALLSGRTRMTGSYKGKPFKAHYRYIDIYAKRGGEWKIVSVQITRVAE